MSPEKYGRNISPIWHSIKKLAMYSENPIIKTLDDETKRGNDRRHKNH
jgi:hypothetical protein